MRHALSPAAINFALTNRLPRALCTIVFGRLSKLKIRWLARLMIGIWQRFSDLDLSDAQRRDFDSLHDCFTRELRPGARPIQGGAGTWISPCDAIIGAHGVIEDMTMLQAKGMAYRLDELLGSPADAERYRNATYITLRLTAQMYHRFHSPADCRIDRVDYISGDCWNVNPPALDRVPRLFCRNERAVIHCQNTETGEPLALVAIAAILVASIRLRFADVLLHLRYRGTNPIACAHVAKKGDELGWFEHGSTIIVLAPQGTRLAASLSTGQRIRMGEVLLESDSPQYFV
jgi:phosphatidylserine decarboxylase